MIQKKCGNPACDQRRSHRALLNEHRRAVMCSVPVDHVGKVFCSLSCACEAGYYSVRHGLLKEPKDDTPLDRDEVKESCTDKK